MTTGNASHLSKWFSISKKVVTSLGILSLGYYYILSPLLNRFLYYQSGISLHKLLGNESLDTYADAEGTKILIRKGTQYEYFSHHAKQGSKKRYLLIFPNMLSTAAGFVSNYKSFLERNEIHVIVVSLPGFGLSSFTGNSEFSMHNFSQKIVGDILKREWDFVRERFENQLTTIRTKEEPNRTETSHINNNTNSSTSGNSNNTINNNTNNNTNNINNNTNNNANNINNNIGNSTRNNNHVINETNSLNETSRSNEEHSEYALEHSSEQIHENDIELAVIGIENGSRFAISCFSMLKEYFPNARLALFSPVGSWMHGVQKSMFYSWVLSKFIYVNASELNDEHGSTLQVYDREAVKTDTVRSLQLGYGPLSQYIQKMPSEVKTPKEISAFISNLNQLAEEKNVKRIFITQNKTWAWPCDKEFQDALTKLKEEKHQEDVPDTVYDFQEFSESEGRYYYIGHFMELISRLFDIQTLFFSPI